MAPPRSPRCPRCGFSFAWDGRHCGHCPTPARARQLWEGIDRLTELLKTAKDVRPRHQLLIIRECLWRVRDALPEGATEVLEASWKFEAGGETNTGLLLGHINNNLARLYRLPHYSTHPDVGGTAWMCREARSRQIFPDRNLIDFPLPDHLERHRTAVSRYLGDARGRVTPADRPSTDPVRRAVEFLNERADEYRHQQWRASQAEEPAQCDVARDVLGYPEAAVHFLPDWRTSTAVAMARGMYESRDFGAMPILADALQDAGCDDPEVLEHCRGEKPHFRGCWVLESVLATPRE